LQQQNLYSTDPETIARRLDKLGLLQLFAAEKD